MQATIINTKICIVGAGPAGATTSLFLSKMEIPHTIVDAAVFPRDKICGDGLDLKVMRVLNELDPLLVENEIIPNGNFSKIQGCCVILSEKKKRVLTIKPRGKGEHYPLFLTAKRGYFDNFLAQKITSPFADFRQGTAISSINKEGDDWTLHARSGDRDIVIKTKLLVGADGDHSIVLRSLGRRGIDREHYCAALRQYWKGISGINEGNHLEFYLPKSLPSAYLWIFPLPNGEANVGCGLRSSLVAKKEINLRDLFQYLIVNDPALAQRFRHATPLSKPMGWGLPLASQNRMPYGDGYLLVGDAAALICPTTGEGVGTGMMSGLIAARFIKRAIAQNIFCKEIFTHYDREIFKRIKPDIAKYNFFRKTSPLLYNQIVNTLASLGIGQYYFDKYSYKWLDTAKYKKIQVQVD